MSSGTVRDGGLFTRSGSRTGWPDVLASQARCTEGETREVWRGCLGLYQADESPTRRVTSARRQGLTSQSQKLCVARQWINTLIAASGEPDGVRNR